MEGSIQTYQEDIPQQIPSSSAKNHIPWAKDGQKKVLTNQPFSEVLVNKPPPHRINQLPTCSTLSYLFCITANIELPYNETNWSCLNQFPLSHSIPCITIHHTYCTLQLVIYFAQREKRALVATWTTFCYASPMRAAQVKNPLRF